MAWRTKLLTGAFCALMFSPIVQAHHSFSATYDLDRQVSVEGEITRFSFKNPHMLIYLKSTDANGETSNWMIEGEAATRYRHAGWDRDTLKPGDRIRVSGSGTHDGSPMVYIEDVYLLNPATGAVMATLNHNINLQPALGSDPEEQVKTIPLTLPNGLPNFTGAWVENRATSAKPPWGRDPEFPYNSLGAVIQSSWDVSNDPQIFCEPAGVVRKSGFTPHPLAIQQFDDRIVFNYEEYSGTRTVFLSDALPEAGAKSPMGDSVARYEGDKLIIETVNLLSNPTSLLGNYYSDQARVTEIYSRVDDPLYGSQITTVMTLTDPGYLSEPWTISRTKLYADGYQLTDTECTPPLRQQAPAIQLPG